jgi:hypothetical protein
MCLVLRVRTSLAIRRNTAATPSALGCSGIRRYYDAIDADATT